MSKASREKKQIYKRHNRGNRDGNCPMILRKNMTLKVHRKICRELNKGARRAERYQRDYLSRPEMHLQLKRRYK